MPGRRQIVARELALKLQLEKAFGREVRSLFRRIVKDFKTTVSGIGRAPDAKKFLPDWQATLKKHYERVQKGFDGEVLNQQKKCNASWYEKKQEEVDDSAENAALLSLALQKWKEDHSVQSADFITQTTQDNFNDALDEAMEVIREQDLPTDNRTLALTAAAILAAKFSGRVGNILMFETQQAAESAKLAEAEILTGLEPSILSGFGAGIVVTTVKKKRGGQLEINEFDRIIRLLMGRSSILTNLLWSGDNY
jgi:hypothetical protein